ncbi:unnamed protein product [Citrullus colocynthis]|uniref:Uncharacterized protein n=1 Tax=Citrullus colocynthis TaxID=252529 RepID=A0ABP0YBW9_9ROSI
MFGLKGRRYKTLGRRYNFESKKETSEFQRGGREPTQNGARQNPISWLKTLRRHPSKSRFQREPIVR